MFLFWIFRTKTVSRVPCCLYNLLCGVKPLVVLFICLQLLLLILLILHLRGVIDFITVWNTYSRSPLHAHHHYFALNFTTVFRLRDSTYQHTATTGRLVCFKEGTAELMKRSCKCHRHWHGITCGIPSSIWFAKNDEELHLTLRKKPRRIVYAFPIGSSLDLLEIRLQELRNAVDVFVIADDTADRKQLRLPSFLSGEAWLDEFFDRLIYVPYTGEKPLEEFRKQIMHHMSDVRPDDMVLFSESDEIPSKDFLICLKLFDGFPETMLLYYRPLCNAFYNVVDRNSSLTTGPTLSTIGHLLRTCFGDGNCLKAQTSEGLVTLGSVDYPIGWKCSNCTPPLDHVTRVNESSGLYKFAPSFVQEHKRRFGYLLRPQPTTVRKSSKPNNASSILPTYVPVEKGKSEGKNKGNVSIQTSA